MKFNTIQKIAAGLVAGIVLGLLLPGAKAIGLLGTIFVGALKAVAPLLVFLLVCTSIANMEPGLRKRFAKVIALYLVSTVLASIVAVFGSFLFPVKMTLKGAVDTAAPQGLTEIFGNLLSSIVANPVSSLANANYIGILFWAILTGMALRICHGTRAINAISDLSDAISLVVKWVIKFAPLGILGLVYTSVAENGMSIFQEYGKLILLLVGCMLFVALVVNPLLGFLLTRRNPYPLLFTCLKESGISAFFTRSSAANIPFNMDLCKKLGVNESFYSVSIPLGATVNMNGAAVTITVMTMCVCHTLGMEIGIAQAITLSIVAAIGACGSSGVAGGSLLLIPMACSLFNISSDIAMQAVAVGFIIGVIQDSFETALNSSGDVFFTAIADTDRKKKD